MEFCQPQKHGATPGKRFGFCDPLSLTRRHVERGGNSLAGGEVGDPGLLCMPQGVHLQLGLIGRADKADLERIWSRVTVSEALSSASGDITLSEL
jgi:hypothetical protein